VELAWLSEKFPDIGIRLIWGWERLSGEMFVISCFVSYQLLGKEKCLKTPRNPTQLLVGCTRAYSQMMYTNSKPIHSCLPGPRTESHTGGVAPGHRSQGPGRQQEGDTETYFPGWVCTPLLSISNLCGHTSCVLSGSRPTLSVKKVQPCAT
jgi:hypothetical protein